MGIGEDMKVNELLEVSNSEFDEMVKRLGKKAKQGPMKTVWDPVKRVYKNVPVNQKPVKEGSEEHTQPIPGTVERRGHKFHAVNQMGVVEEFDDEGSAHTFARTGKSDIADE